MIESTRTYSSEKPPIRTAPAPVIIDTPQPERARDAQDRAFSGPLVPEEWERVPPDASALPPGLDLEMGPTLQAATMIRQAMRAGKIRLADIPEQFSQLACKAVELAFVAATAGNTGTFAQLSKLALDIQRENRAVMDIVLEQAKLEASLDARKPAGPADPKQMARIAAIVSAQKGTVVSDSQPADEIPPQSDLMRIIDSANAEIDADIKEIAGCDDAKT